MDKEVRGQILNDYALNQEQIRKLLSGEDSNNMVMDPDYIGPTAKSPEVPLDNPRGCFIHYQNIRSVLESALTRGYIPSELAKKVHRAPDYIESLVADK